MLRKCSENLTQYKALETCETVELCDSASGACQLPKCDLSEHSCNGALLTLCNDARTGFDTLENCGAPGQCDAPAGVCTDPCDPGAVRCTPQRELEESEERLSGWQVAADCPATWVASTTKAPRAQQTSATRLAAIASSVLLFLAIWGRGLREHLSHLFRLNCTNTLLSRGRLCTAAKS